MRKSLMTLIAGAALLAVPGFCEEKEHSKVKVEKDGDIKARSHTKDTVTGEHSRTKVKVDGDDGDAKYKTESTVNGVKRKEKAKVDRDGDKTKVKHKEEVK